MNHNRLYAGIISCITLLFSCADRTDVPRAEIPDAFLEVLEGHGDWEKWSEFEAMSYYLIHETNLAPENHFINLKSRKTRIDGYNFQMGYDGENTWISPDRSAYSGKSIRFYYNLYFYFHAIPFVFTDPGVAVEKMDDRVLNGKSYPSFRASFNPGVGDSPEDNYIMLIDPETKRIAYLLYTVTFFGNGNSQLNALKFENYQNERGLFFPGLLTGYLLENDSTTQVRYQVSFSDLVLLDKKFDDSLFKKPENGIYAD